MDWYPLLNSLRIAAISCVLVFFLGIFAAYYASKLPRAVKGIFDVVLTLPMVLPPTVCGYFLLFDDEETENTDKCDRDTDDAEYRCPGLWQIEIERHKSAKYRKYCHKRHH